MTCRHWFLWVGRSSPVTVVSSSSSSVPCFQLGGMPRYPGDTEPIRRSCRLCDDANRCRCQDIYLRGAERFIVASDQESTMAASSPIPGVRSDGTTTRPYRRLGRRRRTARSRRSRIARMAYSPDPACDQQYIARGNDNHGRYRHASSGSVSSNGDGEHPLPSAPAASGRLCTSRAGATTSSRTCRWSTWGLTGDVD